MTEYTCPRCGGPAVRLTQTGELSCARQCAETLTEQLARKQLEGLTADLTRLLKQHTPEGYSFTLVLANFGSGAMAYASTVLREDAKHMLRELLDKMETEKPS